MIGYTIGVRIGIGKHTLAIRESINTIFVLAQLVCLTFPFLCVLKWVHVTQIGLKIAP